MTPPASETMRAARATNFAIYSLGAFLLIGAVAALVLLRSVIATNEVNLGEYLGTLGRTMVTPPREYFWFLEFADDADQPGLDQTWLADYRDSNDRRNLRDALAGAESESLVASAAMLSLKGNIIMHGDGVTPPVAEQGTYASVDAEAIKSAAAGTMASPQRTLDNPTRRIYLPVRNPNGILVAVLRLEAEQEPFLDLQKLRGRLFLGFIVGFILLAFLYRRTAMVIRRMVETERAAARKDRLAALGTMTAGISHELRNPLGIIMLQIEELKAVAETIPGEKDRRQVVGLANDLTAEVGRMRSLTEQFLQFSRSSAGGAFQVISVDVATVAGETVRLWTKGTNPERREVSFTAEPDLPRARFAADPLRQILINLLQNADQAIGEKQGSITIAIAADGDAVVVSVKDNGPGIAADVLPRLFEPFFTTRAKGTGLGLSVSRALAESAGGQLEARNAAGSGAEFVLRLTKAGS